MVMAQNLSMEAVIARYAFAFGEFHLQNRDQLVPLSSLWPGSARTKRFVYSLAPPPNAAAAVQPARLLCSPCYGVG